MAELEHRWLTREEAADHLRISRTMLDKLRRAGCIGCTRIGTLVRFDRGLLDRWLESQTTFAVGPPRHRGGRSTPPVNAKKGAS